MSEQWRRRLGRVRGAVRPRSRVIGGWRWVRRRRFGLRPLHNLLLDLRFGGAAGGNLPNPFSGQGASRIQSTDYAALTRLHLRNGIGYRAADVLVDVGCGRGRVLNWWLSRGLGNRMIGLELVPGVAEETRSRLRRHPNVRVLQGDAVANLPAEGTFFFLYNPFDEATMERFAERLLARAAEGGRLRVLYFNCRHLRVFRAPHWQVELLDTGEPEPAALIVPAAGQGGATG